MTSSKKLFVKLALFACAALGLAACGETPPVGTAITNVTIIDGVNGVREEQTVLIVDDRIAAIVNAGDPLPEPGPAVRIDGSGKYLIPGLWDMHVHLTYDDAFTDDMPRLFLRHGITSVRDTGGLMHKIQPVVERMRAPDALAPRVFYSGPLLDGNHVVYDGDSRPEIGVQNATIEAARARVRELEAAGVDFVKIYEMVSPDIFEALVDEARSLDLPIAAHVPLSMVASRAGPAVDSMEHLRNIEMDCATNSPTLYEERLTALAAEDVESGFALRSALHRAQRLPAIANYDEARCERTIASLRATTQVPTLGLLTLSSYSPFARPDWPAVMAQVPEAARDAWQAATDAFAERSPDDVPDTTYAEWGLDMVGKMHAAGVPIGAGTDTPIGWALPGDSLHVELERLVEAGLSTLDALTSATLRPAEFNRVSHEIGVVNVGYYADLVVLSENPLTDIRNARAVDTVIAAGRVLPIDELR